jgi:ACS family tartrate transporter-like MFS transporter
MSQAKVRSPREAALHKAALRLIPLLALLYFVSFLDRVNVGFGALTMNADLGLTATTYGHGAGIFFLGYILFAVPANVALHRIGASRWIATIAIVWGCVSLSMAFIRTPTEFLLCRFLLGAAESGFFPGVMLYTTYWFPDAIRGRIIANFFVAVPLSNVFGAPLSSWLLTHGILGLRGWQTMFLIESLPTIALGALAAFWLTDKPAQATAWLDAAEREALGAATAPPGPAATVFPVRAAVNLAPWLFGLLYFLIVIGLYGFGFWAPQVFQSLGQLSVQTTGWVTAIPYLGAAICMYFWSRHSDRTGERYWHVALAVFVGALGFFLAARVHSVDSAVIAFMLSTIGIYSACPVFWTLPTCLLTGLGAATGIGIVNSLGNLAGYLAPVMMGWLRQRTGGYVVGINLMAASMVAAGLLSLLLARLGRLQSLPDSSAAGTLTHPAQSDL